MAKKKKKNQKLFENAVIEPADTQPASLPGQIHGEHQPPAEEQGPPSIEASTAQQAERGGQSGTPEEAPAEETLSAPVEPGTEATPLEPIPHEGPEPEVSSADASRISPDDEESADDLLDDVRRSLIEEESDRTKKESRWWQRIGKKERGAEPEDAPAAEIDLPGQEFDEDILPDRAPEADSQGDDGQINELIDMLEVESQSAAAERAVEELPPAPEPEVDLEKLKEQAFRPRTAQERSESDSDVRSVALESGEEVFVEVEAREPDQFEERLKGLENALKPYRRYIYLTLAFLGIVMAAIAALLIVSVYRQSRPEPTPAASNLPYPTGVSLPGGWIFQLGRGVLENGKWEPGGAEWLEGTEICRWVSLPSSRQLEAVVRTLSPGDPIELVMSNNDRLVYRVYSIYQMTPEEIQALDSGSPCLLLILTQSDSEKRWVLTALP